MDALRATMHDGDIHAVRRFRELHVVGIALNFMQLAAVGWAMTQLKL
jgi:methylglyoxal synthase